MSQTDRAELRRQMRARRMALGPAERIAAARGVAEQLEQLPEFLTDLRVGAYWAVRGELPLSHALPALFKRGQIVFLPVLGDERLRFAPWLPGQDLAANQFGIPEPEQNAANAVDAHALDLVLVPLLAFDRRGHRLGTGGGWYDRSFEFLSRVIERPGNTVLCGVAYSFQEAPMLPVEAHDVRLDFVVTERELIDCNPVPQ